MSRLVLIGGILGGVVLLLAGGGVAALVVAGTKKPLAQNTTPGPKAGDEAGDKPPEFCPPVVPHDDEAIPEAVPLRERPEDQPPDNKPPEAAPPRKPRGDNVVPVRREVETLPEKPWLPAEEQQKVDQAIERGVEYLRKALKENGAMRPARTLYPVAAPAFGGLTLLECGVQPDDPQVLELAEIVRKHAVDLNRTYELALCVLFLDRLGDPKDKPRIQTLALRLIAGQTNNGGWSYFCPVLNEKDERDLLTALQDQGRIPESITEPPTDNKPAEITVRSGDKSGNDRTADKGTYLQSPGATVGPPPPGNLQGGRTKPADPAPTSAPKNSLENLSPVVRKIAALQPPEPVTKAMGNDTSDNSNTQFATLAVWVAGRHDVPTARACALIDRRFRTSQFRDGAWGYPYTPPGGFGTRGSPAMTCAGLLGLAVGCGATAPEGGPHDEAIRSGLKHLGTRVGNPQVHNMGTYTLYYLWSVERVGVLYNVRTIGDKDWYAWGSALLVKMQNKDGSWPWKSTGVDVCFALLFLKRANLTRDLSTRIEYIELRGSGKRE